MRWFMRSDLADGLGRTQVGASLETTEDRKESPRIDGDFMIDFISFSSFFVDLHLFSSSLAHLDLSLSTLYTIEHAL